MANITVVVSGAAGRMGQEVVRAIGKEADLRLVGAVDTANVGQDIGLVAGSGASGVSINSDLADTIRATKPQVLVDFTIPATVMGNIRVALKHKVACVVGTTGLTQENLTEIESLAKGAATPVFIAPNFAIGAVLMMEFAAQAAKYFSKAEIIELHHDKKLDSPSGTALLTAKKMAQVEGCSLTADASVTNEAAPRGELVNDKIRVHSVRLPGYVASQEVIFGGLGQTLSIRHDSLNRESFMPGVVLAIRKVITLKGLTVGLEKLL
jgi:4-hydroxy-tetrahydrodipicolinate reductase